MFCLKDEAGTDVVSCHTRVGAQDTCQLLEGKGRENRRRYLSEDGKDAMVSINNEFK